MKAAGRSAAFSDINVTPLVDVMLVLLIIFMVAAPLFEQGIDIVLPEAATAQELGSPGLSITLTKEHVIYLNNQVMTLKSLREQLKASKRQPVLIRADRSAYVSRLVELWDLCRDVGLKEIHIATMSE